MSKERILSYKMSKPLSAEELQGVSAAGMRSYITANGSYSSQTGYDASVDYDIDL